ncbi:hypothetical protein COY52_09615 [Candidatus Desantisbacteria bacterium CG_4_10_14_0_8_um_filter_48_22]|uniref:Protein kinase domain-containing protein n=1 Tax=Candidatus Desantisbacteria bacterium CG_4_10_14_0_8_um_filter_48_22 TaxID=1974543 RepID=A0A2M7S7H5_9BACT|nr:MAG: hypothetical protein COS16_05470 [Candidatus Desantisbacteria bacterium CG02_land_8_20_14_3_00_49_13]PIZ15495.1 MAG: hypothetical protein COY52_09615 [Candidatus Desantisbacteria bacterium CG_4_10_14_0_8_um_filter_48_22]
MMKKILIIFLLISAVVGLQHNILAQSDFDAWIKGNDLLDKNKPKEALVYLKRAVDIKPNSADNQYSLGLCYFTLEDYGKSLEHFEKAARIDPRGTDYYLGQCSLKLDRISEAKTYFKQGLSREEKPERVKEMEQLISKIDSYRSVVSQAMVHLDEKKYDLAKKEFRHALTYLKTKEAEDGLASAAKLGAEKSKWLVIILIISAVGAAGTAVFFVILMQKKKREFIEKVLPKKIKAAVQAKNFTEAAASLKKLLDSGGKITVLSPLEALTLYRGLKEFDRLFEMEFPTNYFQQFVRELIKLGELADARRMYEKHKAAGGKAQDFSAGDFMKMFAGLKALDDMMQEGVPSAWLMGYAEKFAEEGDYENAFKMLKNGTVIKDQDFYKGDPSSKDAPVYKIVGIYELAGMTPEILKILYENPEGFASYYSQIAEFMLEKQKFSEAGDVLDKKIAYQISSKKDIQDVDYKLMFSIYEKLGRLDEMQPTKVPEKYRMKIIEAKQQKGKFMEALDMMMEKPRSEWKEKEFGICLKLYEGLDMHDNVFDLYKQFRERVKLLESKDVYYEFATFFEKEGKIREAVAIYEAFVNEKILYRDVDARLANLRKSPAERITAVSKEQVSAVTAKSIEQAAHVSAPAGGVVEITGKIGEIGKGRFRVGKEIARSFTAMVYEGQGTQTNRKYAIKKMRFEIADDKKGFEKFLAEAKIVSKFDHPNIVSLVDVLMEGQSCFLVYEYVDGYTLDKMMKGRMKLGETWRILEYVSSAVFYAHIHNVVHGDLKPSNILIPKGTKADTDPDETKVMDFGVSYIAKDILMLATGEMPDKPVYMAPEQHLGFNDRRSDIFSLGVILYEMLTGKVPFEGPDYLPQKEKMAFKPVIDLAPGLPDRMDNVMQKCLQADPSKRYATIEDFMEEMRKV